MTAPYILVCDDHAIVREAIAEVLAQAIPDCRIEQAADFAQALDCVAGDPPDLILCDLAMPGADPRTGIAELLKQAPDVPICVLTGSQDHALMVDLLTAGVSGFVGKFSSGAVIAAAVNLVLAGGRYVPPEVLDLLSESTASEPAECQSVRLTAQQARVLALVGEGKSNKAIAQILNVAPSTVKTHLDQAMRVLGATNRYEAARLAQQHKLL